MSMYSRIFGEHPAAEVLLGALGLERRPMARYRDCYLVERDHRLVVMVLTRLGGANRPDYPSALRYLRLHSAYIDDRDDSFDNTYAAFYYEVPSWLMKGDDSIRRAMIAPPFAERWKKFLADLESGRETTETHNAKKVALELAEQIKTGKGGVIEI